MAATATADQRQKRRSTVNHHLDRRAKLLAELIELDWDDKLALELSVRREGLLPDEVAALLGVSKDWLSKLRQAGTGPRFLKLGFNLVRYRPADLIEWLDARATLFDERPDATPRTRGGRDV